MVGGRPTTIIGRPTTLHLLCRVYSAITTLEEKWEQHLTIVTSKRAQRLREPRLNFPAGTAAKWGLTYFGPKIQEIHDRLEIIRQYNMACCTQTHSSPQDLIDALKEMEEEILSTPPDADEEDPDTHAKNTMMQAEFALDEYFLHLDQLEQGALSHLRGLLGRVEDLARREMNPHFRKFREWYERIQAALNLDGEEDARVLAAEGEMAALQTEWWDCGTEVMDYDFRSHYGPRGWTFVNQLRLHERCLVTLLLDVGKLGCSFPRQMVLTEFFPWMRRSDRYVYSEWA